MRKDLMRFHEMMTKIKNPLKIVEGEETEQGKEVSEAERLGVKTDDLPGMPSSTRSIVYTARINAARNAAKNKSNNEGD